MNETNIPDISKIDDRAFFEAKSAPEPSVDGDFQRELLTSLVMLMPESSGRTLASTGGQANGTALQTPASQREAGHPEEALPKDSAKGLKELLDSQDAKKSANETKDLDRQDAEKRQKSIDEKVSLQEPNDKKINAREARKGVRSAASTDKDAEKFNLSGETTKESAQKGLKGEMKIEPSLEGAKPQEVKASKGEKSNQDSGGDSSGAKSKFSLSTDGALETEGESIAKGSVKEAAFIAKASLQGQANNNAIVGAINNNGSTNAPQIKADITSLGTSITQSTANGGFAAAVKSVAPVRSTAFDNILVRQVSSRMAVTFKNNVGKALLALNPPELGRLKVEIVIENSRVKATIATESVIVRDALESNLPLLREALLAQGLTVDDLSIMLGDSSAGGDGSRWSGSAKRGALPASNEGEPTEEILTGIQNIANDSLDIFI